MANFIFYGDVSSYWVKIAPKLVGLRIDGWILEIVVIMKNKKNLIWKIYRFENQT